MSIVVDQERLAQVPALIAHPGGRLAPLPTVLWFHGFGADKGLHLPELFTLGYKRLPPHGRADS